jgi:hypothetical protein
MTIFYLYVKTHNRTGRKYLGHTIQNPILYEGSGVNWRKHLDEHGNDVSTTIVDTFNNNEDLAVIGRYWSKTFDIVKSKEWANSKIETGSGRSNKSLKNNYKQKYVNYLQEASKRYHHS